MGRKCAGSAEEYDAFTPWRSRLFWQRGELRKTKRRANKRDRRASKREIRESDE